MITKFSIFKESILIPRNLDSRQEKLKQQNRKMLQQEIIEGDLTINSNFDFNLNPDQVKVRTIKGHVILQLDHFPSWMKNLTIEGNFYCDDNELTTLENCPKSVGGFFYCTYNKLTTLKGCPQSVGGGFYCCNNELTTLEGCPQSINGNFNCANNQLKSLDGCPQSVGGSFYCNNNTKKFTKEYVQSISDVKDNIYC